MESSVIQCVDIEWYKSMNHFRPVQNKIKSLNENEGQHPAAFIEKALSGKGYELN